jgi:hypothetical protein
MTPRQLETRLSRIKNIDKLDCFIEMARRFGNQRLLEMAETKRYGRPTAEVRMVEAWTPESEWRSGGYVRPENRVMAGLSRQAAERVDTDIMGTAEPKKKKPDGIRRLRIR